MDNENKRITPENSSLWIVNYKRRNLLLDTIRYWLVSFPFKEVNIIMNHSSNYDIGLELGLIEKAFNCKINIYRNIFRFDWETGSIAQCWNMCMRGTFLDKQWCIMSQDDVIALKGWDTKINESNYITYIAPWGDSVQIQSLEGFEAVGWFEERFRAIGGPEADYLQRCIRLIPERLSAHDDHVWKLRHNLVGLEDHFFQGVKSHEFQEVKLDHVTFFNEECYQRYIDKWSDWADNIFLAKNYNIQPNWREIDWYPSYTRKLIELGRINKEKMLWTNT